MIDFMTWLEVNKKRLAIGAGALIALGFGVYVWNYLDRQKESTASAALLELRPPINSGTNQPVISSAQYLQVAESHAGTAAAQRAIVLAAGALFSEGKYAEAQAQFERLLRDHPASVWAADATYGIAASLESQGKRDEALTAYQRVLTSYGSESVAVNARLALARIYEGKGQPDLALKQYEEVSRPTPMGMTMSQQEALMRREKLLKKHPNLSRPAATNSAAMMGSTNGPVMMQAPAPSVTPAATNQPAGPAE